MKITIRKISAPGASACALGLAVTVALLLCSCASTIDAPSQLPSSDLPEGYGTAIGSILLSVPTDIADVHDQEIVQSLVSKKYEATIGRFVFHEYGFASRTAHPGNRHRVAFAVGVEKQFVVRAPAGTYSFQKISQIVAGLFGEQPGGCRMEGIANFDIHPGKTTYIGRLSIVAEFKQDKGGPWLQALINLGKIPTTLPEAALSMRVSAIDMKAQSLRAIARDESSLATGIDTSLMFVDGRDKWDCVQPLPPTPPPGAPRQP